VKLGLALLMLVPFFIALRTRLLPTPP